VRFCSYKPGIRALYGSLLSIVEPMLAQPGDDDPSKHCTLPVRYNSPLLRDISTPAESSGVVDSSSGRSHDLTPVEGAGLAERDRDHKSSWRRLVERFSCFHPVAFDDDHRLRNDCVSNVEISSASLINQVQSEQSCMMSTYLVSAPSSVAKRSKSGRSRSSTYDYPEQPQSDIFL
jgi:hypothetical protein